MNGKMIFKDPKDLVNGDAVVFDADRMDIYNKIDGQRAASPTTTLKRCKAGTAAANAWTELPGIWLEKPTVLVSAKKVPTYFARHRYATQRFTLGCTVEATGAPYKYRIYPTLAFIAGAGGSGTIQVNEKLGYSVVGSWIGTEAAPRIGTRITSPQHGAGTLQVNFSWMTRAKFTTNYQHGGTHQYRKRYWRTNCQIYLDKYKVNTVGVATVESQILVSESNMGYGQEMQTKTVTGIDLGDGTCSWVLRKETQCPGGYDEGDYGGAADRQSWLTLNWYSYTTAARTTYPAGEIFYLAIGR
jgi:hypothetical protein